MALGRINQLKAKNLAMLNSIKEKAKKKDISLKELIKSIPFLEESKEIASIQGRSILNLQNNDFTTPKIDKNCQKKD